MMSKNIFLVMSVILAINFAQVQSAQLGKELLKCGMNVLKNVGKEIAPSILPFSYGYTRADYLIMNEDDFKKEENQKKFKAWHNKCHSNCDTAFDCYKQIIKKKYATTGMVSWLFNFPSVAQSSILGRSLNYLSNKSNFLANYLSDFFVLPRRIFYQRISGKSDDLRPIFKFLPRNFSSLRIKNLGYLTLLIITYGWKRFLLKQIFSLPNYIPYVPEITSWIVKNSGLLSISKRTGITSFYQLDLSEYLINLGLKKWYERNKSFNA